jgi:hypothetical protein
MTDIAPAETPAAKALYALRCAEPVLRAYVEELVQSHTIGFTGWLVIDQLPAPGAFEDDDISDDAGEAHEAWRATRAAIAALEGARP